MAKTSIAHRIAADLPGAAVLTGRFNEAGRGVTLANVTPPWRRKTRSQFIVNDAMSRGRHSGTASDRARVEQLGGPTGAPLLGFLADDDYRPWTTRRDPLDAFFFKQ